MPLRTVDPNYRAAPDLLGERVILVTGAGDGIGRAAALAYARHGATVVLLDRSIPKLEQVYDAIAAQGLPQAAIYPMDLEGATPADHAALAATIERTFGRLDGLLHNAAELGVLTPLQQYEPPMWYRVMQVNLNAPFLLSQACLGLLAQAPDAAILFVSDRVGRRGLAYWGAYAVSKAALEGLMQILAEETENHTSIRVNSLDPGAVLTSLRRQAYPGENPGRLARPEDGMGAFLYLMGPDSRGITGAQFVAGTVQDPGP